MVTIRDSQILLSSDAVSFNQKVSAVLQCMREELDDHRLAINENTGELDATSECLNEVNRKLDKLTERVDELTLLVKGVHEEKTFDLQPLSNKEKEVFHALYALTETQPFASYDQIARKALMTKELVSCYVTSMIQKGVPVLKKHDGNRVYLRLEAAFRQCQAKKNLVGLNSPLTCWL